MSETRGTKQAGIAADGAFDVIVVGGGINGIGTFRDLSMQGLRVLLVERNDFCSGCSAAPSRMIHGGLRYLENGEFGLVRESLRERDALLCNAHHMVRPLPTTVPIRTVFSGVLNSAANILHLRSRPAARGALTIKAGLMLYDWVTRHRRILPKHVFRGARSTREHWPALHANTRYSATYYDAWISYPERLGLELLDDGEAANSASVAINYSTLRAQSDGALTLTDCESGTSWPVSARAIVNATGAWVDSTAAELPGHYDVDAPMVEGTKGSHLIIDNDELKTALKGHMIYYENSDGRVCILFPYLANVLVGATDIRVTKPGRTRCEEEEKSYILQSLSRVFPDISIHPDDIVFTYSGIRPLPKSRYEFTGRISRGHFVRKLDGPVPQFCMVGGKWTTFRAFAEQTADDVLEALGTRRVCDTTQTPIGGGRDYPTDTERWIAETCENCDVTQDRAAHVLDHYGSNARTVLQACRDSEKDMPIAPGCPYTHAEINYLIRHERVVHLADVILRRTDLAISGRVSTSIIAGVADIAADCLGWTARRKNQEIAALTEELGDYHGVSAATLDDRSTQEDRKCA